MSVNNLPPPARALRPLFDPRSVAIVGASNDGAKWGNRLAASALRGAGRRRVHLVNRSGAPVLGQRTFTTLADLPEAPELAVVAVPAAAFAEVVDDCLRLGVSAIVGITAGLGELGGTARTAEAELAARVRAAGAVLVGPNCAGLSDLGTELALEFGALPAGSIGVISQSGNLIDEFARRAIDVGLGFSRSVSLGNQADLTVVDFIRDFATHEPTQLIACYLEDFRDGHEFVAAASSAARHGKPVVVLAGGLSSDGARAARSHTGAMVSDELAVRAACRAAGAHLVSTPGELVDVAQALLRCREKRGGVSVAVLADGGGAGAIACDTLARAGLATEPFSASLQSALRDPLPPPAVVTNPVDLAGAGEGDLGVYARALAQLVDAPEVDAVLVTGYFGGYSFLGEVLRNRELAAAEDIAAVAQTTSAPVVVHTIFPESPVATVLHASGVPVYARVESAVRGLRALTTATASVSVRANDAAPGQETAAWNYWEARELVARAGIAVAPAAPARDLTTALEAADRVGYPVVLKAVDRLHKSDAGGVVLNLADRSALGAAVEEMVARLRPQELAVERMARAVGAMELIVGVRRDPRFGPLVLVGFGGIHAELIADRAVCLGPATADELYEQILALRAAPLLMGARGRPVLDVRAVACAGAALSRTVAARPDLHEVEINPLLVLERGVMALDARVIASISPVAVNPEPDSEVAVCP